MKLCFLNFLFKMFHFHPTLILREINLTKLLLFEKIFFQSFLNLLMTQTIYNARFFNFPPKVQVIRNAQCNYLPQSSITFFSHTCMFQFLVSNRLQMTLKSGEEKKWHSTKLFCDLLLYRSMARYNLFVSNVKKQSVVDGDIIYICPPMS